jgi:hypothetical protein
MTDTKTDNLFFSRCMSGMTIGIMTAGLFQPIDALRIRSFLNPDKMGSPYSLKNGLAFNMLSSGVKAVVSFPVRERINEKTNKYFKTPVLTEIMASALTGGVLSIIGTPINVIKIRCQNHSGTNLSSFAVGHDIYQKRGLRGFYQGSYATMLRDISWNVVYFPMFDYLVTIYPNKLFASITSSMIATTIGYPFDGIRLFCQKVNNNVPYNFWVGFKKSFEFSKANRRSFGYALVRVPLATTTTHMGYLYLNKQFEEKKKLV